jgi:type VI secretion system protein ImpK
VDTIYWASAEVLIAATRIGSGQDLPPPDQLRQEILGLLHQMVSRCRETGVPDADTAEARYAIVAFIDERILKSNWAGRAEWMSNPLQLQLYREYAAGENFFVRLAALLKSDRPSPAIEVYYLCISLGFAGATGQQAQSLGEAARARLSRASAGVSLSPHALPSDHYTVTKPRRPLLLALGLSCVFVVGVGLLLLRWSLDTSVQKTEQNLAATRTSPTEALQK